MNFKDLIEETYIALTANMVRSGLTILGIVIGISSVIAMVSIGTGASSKISSSIEALGSNLIQVMPGAARQAGGFSVSLGRGGAKTLTNDDAAAIASGVSNINAVSPEVAGRYQVVARGTNTNTSVEGVTSAYPAVHNLQVDAGDFISDSQNNSAAKVAVLGPTTMTDLFGDTAVASDAVGQTIRINGMEFKVIGVTVAKGGSGFTNADDVIYIPQKSAQRYLTGGQYLSTVAIQAASSNVMSQVQDDVTNLLLARHHVSDPTASDFSVLNQNDLLGAASSVTQTLTLLLAAIAGISLVVGGIGIMNMMLTNVTERTREIGLRKAIGAKKSDISRQFLFEALMLTLVGGVMGIALGWLIAFVVNATGLVSTQVSLMSVALAFGVSVLIGIVFGWYPARRAASLNPIEALRYE